jgi:hypothetical protein
VLDRTHTVFGRAEWVKKSAEDLVLDAPPHNFDSHRAFPVGAVTLGYVRELSRWNAATFGLGVMGTVNVVGADLKTAYGSRTPLGAMIFLRLRPIQSPPMDMGGMKMND